MTANLITTLGLDGMSKDIQTETITAWVRHSNPNTYAPGLKDWLTQEGYGEEVEQAEQVHEERRRAEELTYESSVNRSPVPVDDPRYGEYARHWRAVSAALAQELIGDDSLRFSVRNRIANRSWLLLHGESAPPRSST